MTEHNEESAQDEPAGPWLHGVARVLIVDASPYVRRSLGRALGMVADVTVKDSGVAALEALRTDAPFDLVLCDTAPGEISGAEVFREAIKLAPANAEHFVFLTADPDELAAELPDAPCLAKPLDREQIDALVAGLMRKSMERK